jgi:photosystem II stability/assembly factor-like uncharacterized protein
MTRFYLSSLFVVLSAFAFGQGSWTSLDIPNATRYDDVFFINPNVGWTAGGWNLKVHKTIDGGETWTEAGLINNKYLRSIEFMDENIGVCGSLDSSLYRTTDGGQTWTDVAPTITPKPKGVCGLAKADENTIYGVGVWSEPAFLIKSVDKGMTWTYTDMSAYANSLIDAFFIDANHGFVTGSKSDEEGGIVLYTDDGGVTWEEKYRTNGFTDRIWKIQTPDSVHFYGAVEALTEGNPTRIIRSNDGGQTWETVIVNNAYFYCQMVGFIDARHGWTGGNGTLFETSDAGVTWKKITVGATYNRFTKINDELAYMTGKKVYKYTRVITGTPDHETHDPIHSLEVSPNPAKAVATIKVKFGNPTTAQILVYSAVGQILQKVFTGNADAGEKTFTVDLSQLPSQTLLVILKTNEGLETRKLLKK